MFWGFIYPPGPHLQGHVVGLEPGPLQVQGQPVVPVGLPVVGLEEGGGAVPGARQLQVLAGGRSCGGRLTCRV